MTGKAQVNGAELWYEITGEGEPVIQIHGAGFGTSTSHRRRRRSVSASASSTTTCAATASPTAGALRHGGLGRRRRRLDALDIPEAHVHGTSMGGMIAIVFAGSTRSARPRSINCAAAKLGGRTARLQELIDIARI